MKSMRIASEKKELLFVIKYERGETIPNVLTHRVQCNEH